MGNTIYMRTVLLASASAAAFLAAPASAQDMAPAAPQTAPAPDAPAPQDADVPTTANDIVITARRKDERLMDVPVVITALTADTVSRYQSNDLTAIGNLTPTVIIGTYKANGGGSIAIRGISSPANQTGFEQAVSVAIDGIQTSNGQVARLGFFDVARVEVLKGPQALFFGKNNTAGVISIISASPTKDLSAGMTASYEFVGDEATVDAYVSGPVTSTLGFRVAVRYRNLDGWLRNTSVSETNPFYNPATGAPASVGTLPGTSNPRPGDEDFVGRVTLAFEPSNNFKATLRVLGTSQTDAGPGVSSQNIGPCTGPYPRVSGIADPSAECVIDNRTTSGDVPGAIRSTIRDEGLGMTSGGKLKAVVSALSLQGRFGSFTLASNTGYNDLQYKYFAGFDQTTYSQLAQFEGQKATEFSQELRLSSNFSGVFNFVAGGYFQRTTIVDHYDTKLSDGAYNAAANRYTSFETFANQTGKTYSVFGQAIFKFTPQLELAGGARYTREEKDYRKNNVYGVGTFLTAGQVYPGSDQTGYLKGSFRDDNVSPEATLTWTPDSRHTLFIAYRSGFKSGGFGLTNPLQTSTRIGDVDFESEKAKGFEVGARLIALNNRLNVSAAAFAYTFSNLQVNTYDPARIAYTINNAGGVRQRGFELEFNFAATRNFVLHGALAYVNNRFRNFTGQCYSYAFPTGTVRATAVAPPNCSFVNTTALTLQQVYDGRAPARSPEWSGNFGAIGTIPLGDYKIEVTGDAYYSGSYYAADTLAPPTLQPDFWRFNAGLTFSPTNGRWNIGVFGKNLSNKYYLLYAADRTGGAGVPGSIGEQRGVIARGREIAMRVGFKF
ncbi:MAG: TonB-dependent receptor [Pseudomonadota bacterium]